MLSIFTRRRISLPLTVMMLLGISCRKDLDLQQQYDWFKKHPVDCNTCKIQEINVTVTDELGTFSILYSFAYNTAGNPKTVKNTMVATGNPNTVFKYDKKGRLTEMIRPYENDSYETWQKYYYNNINQIAVDTEYIFGDYIDSVAYPFTTFGFWTHHYKYDNYNRIVARLDSAFGSGYAYGTEYDFQYDAKGNLIQSGVTYDDKVNFLATNPVWMFVSCNYSVNNGFTASSYNSRGLPLSFDGAYNALDWVISWAGRFDVTYSCK